MPSVLKSKALIPKLSQEAQETMAVLRDAKIELKAAEKTGREAEQAMQKAKKSFERVQKRAQDVPSTVEIQKEVSDLKKEADAAEKVFRKMSTNLANAQVLQSRAQQQYTDAQQLYGEALSSVSSARAIADAVNPDNVQEILQGMAGGLLSCVAAAKVPLAGTALVGTVSVTVFCEC